MVKKCQIWLETLLNLLSRNQTLTKEVKKHSKLDIKSFLVQFCCISLICAKYFFWDCRSPPSTADPLTAVSDRAAGACNRFGATRAVVLDIPKTLSIMKFQVSYLSLFRLLSVIDGFGWLWMQTSHKSIYLILEFFKASFFVLLFS